LIPRQIISTNHLPDGTLYPIPRGSVENRSGQYKSPKKVKSDGTKNTHPGILKNKDTPAATKKKSIPKSVISPNLGVNNSTTAHAKGKKKKGGRKVSFDGKKAVKATKSRK
jgi:hypothetical protein